MKGVLPAICVALLSAAPAAAATITFDEVFVPPNGDVLGGDVISGGFVFDSSGDHLHRVNGGAAASNGTTTLGIHEFPGFDNIVTIRPLAGGLFSLNAIDFGEWLGSTPHTNIQITGVGGSNPSTSFTLDGFMDGPGGGPDFQTLTFDATWSNLTSVTLNGIGGPLDVNGQPLGSFVLDNVVVNTEVPEPASLVLLGTGLAAVVRRRLRRR